MDDHVSRVQPNRGGTRDRSRGRLARVALVILLFWPLTVRFQTPALGWGRLGHRAAAKLTESRLNPAAKLAISKLLEPGESLADASTWADEIRRARPETGPWHYVNVPSAEERYSAKFCPKEGCVVSKIADFRKLLADPGLPRKERQEALKFLVHFVQDMHQPLHVGGHDDRGGNDFQVQFFGEGSNLHRVWDSGMIERQFETEDDLLKEIGRLASTPSSSSWPNGTVEDWTTESLLLVAGVYIQPYKKMPLNKGGKLGPPYLESNLPIVLVRVSQAGIRLAAILNEAFPETPRSNVQPTKEAL